MAHTCEAAVVACIDFRFRRFYGRWIDENIKSETCDFIGFAGSTKELPTILGQIDISVRLHHPQRVVLFHHEECGAYGTESTFERHSKDLKKAKEQILQKYPNLQVDTYYLHLDGTFEPTK